MVNLTRSTTCNCQKNQTIMKVLCCIHSDSGAKCPRSVAGWYYRGVILKILKKYIIMIDALYQNHLCHGIARSNTTELVMHCQKSENVTVLPHPPHSRASPMQLFPFNVLISPDKPLAQPSEVYLNQRTVGDENECFLDIGEYTLHFKQPSYIFVPTL